MRHLLLLLLPALLAARPAPAQTPTARPDTAATAAPLAAATDTAAAIHRLFSAKRRQSAAVIIGTVGIGLLNLAIAEDSRHTAYPSSSATPFIATGISLLSIPATGVEIGYYRQFTRRKERRALEAFQAHQLPQKIRRRLKAEYFRPVLPQRR